MSTELSEPKTGIAMQILLALSPSAPSPTIPELAEEFFGHLAPAKARIYISQQVWQLRARGWAIEKDGRGCLLLGREHYRLLLDWYRRRTTALGCYGVRPFTPENLKRFCEVLLEDRNHEAHEEHEEKMLTGYQLSVKRKAATNGSGPGGRLTAAQEWASRPERRNA